MKQTVCLVFLFLLIVSPLFSLTVDTALSTEELTVKLNEIEKELSQYKELYKERKAIINKDFNAFKSEVAGRLDSFEEDYSLSGRIMFFASLAGLLGVSLGGIFTFIFGTRKKLNEYADKKIRDNLDKIFNEKRESILHIIKEHDKEKQIRKNSSILVLSGPGDIYRDEVQGLLAAWGFEKTDYRSIDTVNLKERKEDLILINNFKATMKSLDEVFSMYKPTVPVIHLIDGRDPMKEENQPSLYARANALHTLYPRMIELLTFKEIMKKAGKEKSDD